MRAPQVHGQLLVDEDPDVVISDEGERRGARVLEPGARDRREAVVVRPGRRVAPGVRQAVEREEHLVAVLESAARDGGERERRDDGLVVSRRVDVPHAEPIHGRIPGGIGGPGWAEIARPRLASRHVDRNAVRSQRRQNDAGKAIAGVVLEVGGAARFLVALEVVIDDGQVHRRRDDHDVVAFEARLDLARPRAAVAVDGVAVVALLAVRLVDGQQQSVAAGRRARAARGGADRLEATERRAAVAGRRVAVVALLGAFLDLVPTDRRRARRGSLAAKCGSVARGRRADPTFGHRRGLALERAVGATTIAVRRVAVVALFVAGDLAVAALGGAADGAGWALPAALEGAVGGAAVAARRVAVVALLFALDHVIAADHVVDAGHPHLRTRVVRLDDAGARAAVAARRVAVLAVLSELDDAVAARRGGGAVAEDREVGKSVAGAAVVTRGAAASALCVDAGACHPGRIVCGLGATHTEDEDAERERPTSNAMRTRSPSQGGLFP